MITCEDVAGIFRNCLGTEDLNDLIESETAKREYAEYHDIDIEVNEHIEETKKMPCLATVLIDGKQHYFRITGWSLSDGLRYAPKTESFCLLLVPHETIETKDN